MRAGDAKDDTSLLLSDEVVQQPDLLTAHTSMPTQCTDTSPDTHTNIALNIYSFEQCVFYFYKIIEKNEL